jgi:hypothetical protein
MIVVYNIMFNKVKGQLQNLPFYLTGVLVMVCVMVASGSAQTNSPESFMRCQVEGGNLAVRTTSMEFFRQGKETYLTVTQEFWDTQKKSLAETVKIVSEDYDQLWKWVEAENIWGLEDVIFLAVDAPTYIFHLKKGERQKIIKAMSVSTLDNQKYYRFYSLLKKTKERYVTG